MEKEPTIIPIEDGYVIKIKRLLEEIAEIDHKIKMHESIQQEAQKALPQGLLDEQKEAVENIPQTLVKLRQEKAELAAQLEAAIADRQNILDQRRKDKRKRKKIFTTGFFKKDGFPQPDGEN